MSYFLSKGSGLSDLLKGKSTDELFEEMKNSLDENRKKFFNKSNSSWGNSSGSSFSRGFPFDDDSSNFEARLDKLVEEHPDLAAPLQSWRQKTPDGSKKKKTEDPKSESVKKEDFSPLNTNLRNTVPNMQQRNEQDDGSDERNQRSQSAPPGDQGKNLGSDNGRSFASGQQTRQFMGEEERREREPVVRHIPIFVEGRDEPVLPKDVVDSPSAQRRPSNKTQDHPEHIGTHNTNNHRPTRQVPINNNHSNTQNHGARQIPVQVDSNPSHHQGARQIPIHQDQNLPPHQGARQMPKHNDGQTSWEIPVHIAPQAKQPPPKPVKMGPLDQVKSVEEEVTSLMKQVEDFNGTSRQDKNYIYLDEMLTRNLLKLDTIETEGKDDVRLARKETIKSIQRCISMLENKVPVVSEESSKKTDGNSDTLQEKEQANQENNSENQNDPSRNSNERENSPKSGVSENVTESTAPSAS